MATPASTPQATPTKPSTPQQDRYARRQQLRQEASQLPISTARNAIVSYLKTHSSAVIVGETGSGKTTQVPQFLVQAGLADKGMIAVTQPRRVAAITLAQRVADEMGTPLGGRVGYSIRFDEVCSPQTVVKFMTDGMLMREYLSDSNLARYSVIILDEAHERTVRTDILFGLLKATQRRRLDLRVIVMSATIDADRFAAFLGCDVLFVQGRQFPVTQFFTNEPQPDYLDASLLTTLQLHLDPETKDGDILVFLTGQDEIDALIALLNNARHQLPLDAGDFIALPLYAALPPGLQVRVFQPAPRGVRKIIVATNVAETSVTINGVRFVVDCGLAKERGFNAAIGIESLTIQPIARAAARQRTGRAGREGPGRSYRLYTEETFHKMDENGVPEIKRASLAGVLLLMKAFGIEDISTFDFFDAPPTDAVIRALEQLLALGFLEDDGTLSKLGRTAADFPLEPAFARAILAAKESVPILPSVIGVVAMLSTENIFHSPREKRDSALAARRRFVSRTGDHVTYLNVLKGYRSAGGERAAAAWCHGHFVNARALKQAVEVEAQLREVASRAMGNADIRVLSQTDEPLASEETAEQVIKCLLAGLFQNTAVLQQDGTYRTAVTKQIVAIHPSSVLFGKNPKAVMYSELVRTTKQYIRTVSEIELTWLLDASPAYFGRLRKG